MRRINKKIPNFDPKDDDIEEKIVEIKKGQHRHEEDYIYYTGSIYNSGTTDVNAIIEENRTQPLVLKPEEYKVSVVRWTIDLTGEPMMICQHSPGNPMNNTNLVIKMGWGANITLEELVMISIYPSNIPPDETSYKLDPKKYNRYYSIYQYQQLVNMVNNGFKAIWAAFQALPGFPYPGPNQDWAPYISLDTGTGILSLVCVNEIQIENILIGFSENLQNILNLPYDSVTDPVGVITQKYYNINPTTNIMVKNPFINAWSSSIVTIGANMGDLSGKSAYVLCTDHDYRGSWFEIKSIVIVSNLPTVSENYSTPSSQQSGQPLLLNVLTDFGVTLEGGEVLNGAIEYVPTVLRYLSMKSSQAISATRFQFFEVNNRGEFSPVTIAPGSSAEIKLLFEKIEKSK